MFFINQHNQKILNIFLEKVRRDYACDVALVFVYGSAARGEEHEKSDLDLVFVPQTPRAHELSSCFLIGDVGYDFFPMTWARLERIASFEEPLAAVLAGAEVVYSATRDDAERFAHLQGWILDAQDTPLRLPMLEKAKTYLDKAMVSCAQMQIAEDIGHVRQHSGSALYDLSEALGHMNNRYFKGGDKHRLEELLALRQLPDDFEAQYHTIIEAKNTEEIRSATWALLDSTTLMYKRLLAITRPAADLQKTLTGTYEESICNWKHKIAGACEAGDAVAAFQSGVSYQAFLNTLSSECGLPPIDIMQHFQADALPAFAKAVEAAQKQYRQEMEEDGIVIHEYATVDAYQNAMRK